MTRGPAPIKGKTMFPTDFDPYLRREQGDLTGKPIRLAALVKYNNVKFYKELRKKNSVFFKIFDYLFGVEDVMV